MSDSQIHTTKTLASLFRLDIADIEKIVDHYGQPCFSCEENAFLIYVPIFESCVRYESSRDGGLRARLRTEDYTVQVKDMVVVVSSETRYPTSFLLLPDFIEILEQHTDITDDTAMLLTHSAKTPVFFGHSSVIERLADDFDRAEVIASVKQFIERRDEDA